MNVDTRTPDAPDLVWRVRNEYLELPGLALTIEQTERLWDRDRHACVKALSALVGNGFLLQRDDGSYVRRHVDR